MPSEQDRADLAKMRGQAAAKIKDPDQRQKYIAEQGNAEAKTKGNLPEPQYKSLYSDAENTIATDGENKANNVKVLGSYKKGGKVKKTGVYKLHKKERVLNAKQTAAFKVLAGK